jgi:hypothetical protein
MPVKKIHQAVKVLGNKNSDTQRPVGPLKPPPHVKPISYRREPAREFVEVHTEPLEIPFHTHQE